MAGIILSDNDRRKFALKRASEVIIRDKSIFTVRDTLYESGARSSLRIDSSGKAGSHFSIPAGLPRIVMIAAVHSPSL